MPAARATTLSLGLVTLALLIGAWLLLDDGAGQREGSAAPQVAAGAPARTALPDRGDAPTPPARSPVERLAGDLAEAQREALTTGGGAHHAARPPTPRPVEPTPTLIAGLPSGLGVRSRVVDAWGEAVTDARVQLIMRPHGRATWPATNPQPVGDDGWFDLRLTLTEPTRDLGGMELHVSAPGHAPWRALVVPDGGETLARLPPQRLVTLALLADDGSPLVGARVRPVLPKTKHMVPPIFALGRLDRPLTVTDEDGLATLPCAEGALTWQLAIEHPQHSSTVELELAAEDRRASLRLDRHATLEVELGGHVDAWIARGMLPDLRVVFRERDQGQQADWVAPPWAGPRPPGLRAWFDPLHDFAQQLMLGDEVLVQHLSPRPGPQLARITLPPPPAAPPTPRWLLSLELVDGDGRPLLDASRSWGELPFVLLTGADGSTSVRTVASLVGGRVTELPPPVSAHFRGHPDGPRVQGLTPTTPGRLVLDDEDWLAGLASLRLDTSALDPALRSAARVDLSPPSGGINRLMTLPVQHGLTPGVYSWSLSGPGVERAGGEIELVAGEQAVVLAQPAALPDELMPGEAYGMVRGRVTLRSDDPWVELDSVHYEPLDARARRRDSFDGKQAGPHTISAGSFLGGVSPGRYRVSASAHRVLEPEVLVADWPEDAPASSNLIQALRDRERLPVKAISTSVEIEVRPGSLHELELELDASGLGLVFLDASIDGVALSDPARVGPPAWIDLLAAESDGAGEDVIARRFDELPPGGVSYMVPPGVYHLVAWIHRKTEDRAPAAIVPVEVPSLSEGLTASVALNLQTDGGEEGPSDPWVTDGMSEMRDSSLGPPSPGGAGSPFVYEVR